MKRNNAEALRLGSIDLCRDQKGVALILALIMLLVMSVLATTVSFNSNNDFHAMSNYKQSQESFLAAERCIQEGRIRFEIVGTDKLSLIKQNAVEVGEAITMLVLHQQLSNGAMCRSGRRAFDSADGLGDEVKVIFEGTTPRHVTDSSISTTSQPGPALISSGFVVTGKDTRDKDKEDTLIQVNTGTETAVGFEGFVQGGGALPVY